MDNFTAFPQKTHIDSADAEIKRSKRSGMHRNVAKAQIKAIRDQGYRVNEYCPKLPKRA